MNITAMFMVYCVGVMNDVQILANIGSQVIHCRWVNCNPFVILKRVIHTCFSLLHI
jgi:hypothetical protein